MSTVLFHDARLLDTRSMRFRDGVWVLVEGNRITAVSDQPIVAENADKVDCGGRVLMPGLIDAHVHVCAARTNLGILRNLPASLITATAGEILRAMLFRGFTTVRDAGGADQGHAAAVEAGLFVGPRLFISGRAISQTGGHGDFRPPVDVPGAMMGEPCGCAHIYGGIGRIADGVAEVRRAARDEIRLGASQIKIMASGGVASPTDPVSFTQYSMEELRALVEEAEAAETYVMAHAYTPRAIQRLVHAGIRSIEHGNLIDQETAALMAERDVYLVPTLATYHALSAHGREFGFPEDSLAKLDEVLEAGTRSLEIARAGGVKMGFGTDLLGELHAYQGSEFALRAEALSAGEILAGATVVNAELMMRPGELGVVEPGALADILVVDRDPLEDLSVFGGQGEGLRVIMKDGAFVKRPAARSGA
jgi:imidazolonepropionase-like amidohydrolase